MNIKTHARRLIAALALVVPIGLAAMAPSAQASNSRPNLTLKEANGPGANWQVDGGLFSPSRNDVQVWIMDLADGSSWRVFDYKGGIATSSPASSCTRWTCYYYMGGDFSVKGDVDQYRYPTHWMDCGWTASGHKYEAVAYDSADGWVYSNVLNIGVCPR